MKRGATRRDSIELDSTPCSFPRVIAALVILPGERRSSIAMHGRTRAARRTAGRAPRRHRKSPRHQIRGGDSRARWQPVGGSAEHAPRVGVLRLAGHVRRRPCRRRPSPGPPLPISSVGGGGASVITPTLRRTAGTTPRAPNDGRAAGPWMVSPTRSPESVLGAPPDRPDRNRTVKCPGSSRRRASRGDPEPSNS